MSIEIALLLSGISIAYAGSNEKTHIHPDVVEHAKTLLENYRVADLSING